MKERSKRLRFRLAELRITANRLTGRPQNMEETCRSEGLTVDEFWTIALSQPMETLKFERFLLAEFTNPRCEEHGLLELDIRSALRDARKWGEPWFLKTPGAEGGADDLRDLSVRTREAVEYLLRNPMREHLVQPMLRAFMEGEPGRGPRCSTPAPKDTVQKRPRSKGGGKQAAIQAAIKKLGKYHDNYPSFKEYRRDLMAGIPDKARGWSEDSIRRAEHSVRAIATSDAK